MNSTSKNYKKYDQNAKATSQSIKTAWPISNLSSKAKIAHSHTSSTNKAMKLIAKI
jgi:hypothetical protein